MNVVIYGTYFLPVFGGVQTVMDSLAKELVRLRTNATPQNGNVSVTVVTNTEADGLDDSGFSYRVVRQPGFWGLVRLIKEADVLHIAGPCMLPMAIAWVTRRPFVVEHDGYQAACPNGHLLLEPDRSICPGHFMAARYQKCLRCNGIGIGWLRSFFELAAVFPRRWLAGRAAANICPTRHVANRVKLPRTAIVYHGVPDLVVASHQPEQNGQNGIPYFAYVGRLSKEKGVSVMIEAARRLQEGGRDFRLRIVGDGPERSELERMVQEFKLDRRTEFVGSVPSNAIPEIIKNVTAVVMPSVCEDVAPLAASEQLMQGNLIIASDVGGLGEIVNGAGLKFPVGDAIALEVRMRQALDNRALGQELRVKARQHGVEVFGESRMAKQHLEIYEAAIARGTNAR
jgi:glycosyltransferase involved in cell wall biosynthesis